ncbi:hypothetical protein ACWY7G_001076 [Enterobacter hormaechei]|uniref:Uncharacterized protein n=1 Tax=Enterobacter hormaechei TaxID=158836 RepID=A0A927DJD3_9ENTR|nr:hypothetical protein [Enterobacter hormaechei]EKS6616156.1 hypothetical protein [Enterobacter hormaechei]EKU3256730.1 hypothetical protein [Enterobacter hormaechei]EKV8296858.1 hypothetical protein [Enterobacter hormaechei]EKW2277245.1 hypothetical protein [Enterobacter hormaechei]ELC6306976.1 hypothetical protein [Enterobacter hormaechei]
MYNYDDVHKIKANLEWILHHASARSHLRTEHDQLVISDLMELIQTYETLMDLVSKFGASALNSEIIAGLSITEEFIAKVKRNEGAM